MRWSNEHCILALLNPFQTFKIIFVSVLPQTQERSLDILSLLGFEARQRGYYRFDSSCHCEGTLNDARLTSDLMEQIRGLEALIYALKRRDAITNKDSPLYHVSDRVCKVLERAILFVSQMAFTDWNTPRHFHGHTTSRTVLTRAENARIREPGPFEGLGWARAKIFSLEPWLSSGNLITYEARPHHRSSAQASRV